MKWFRRIMKFLPMAVKVKDVIRAIREIGESVKGVQDEVSRIIGKWEHLPDAMKYDVKRLLTKIDDLTEKTADAAGLVGLGWLEKLLRNIIKGDLLKKLS